MLNLDSGHKKVVHIDSKACSVTINNPKLHKGKDFILFQFFTYMYVCNSYVVYLHNYVSVGRCILKCWTGDEKGTRVFTYDSTYSDDARQEDLYEENFR